MVVDGPMQNQKGFANQAVGSPDLCSPLGGLGIPELSVCVCVCEFEAAAHGPKYRQFPTAQIVMVSFVYVFVAGSHRSPNPIVI